MPDSFSRNVVVLTGTITTTPTRRSLATGADVVNFDLATSVDDRTISVPIAWYDPRSSDASSAVVGLEVVVLGTIRRRFFRVGGRTQSRTEVVVESLVAERRAKAARSLRATAAERIRPAAG
jgi:single-strand DNA-binding protein